MERMNPYESPRHNPQSKSYDSIWVSSVGHLLAFQQAYERTSFFQRHLLGSYDIPDGFPFLRAFFSNPWRRTPLVFFAHGCLEIKPNELEFQSTPFSLPLNVLHNIQKTLTFSIHSKDNVMVEPYQFTSPVADFFDIVFVRVRTARADGQLCDDVLLSMATKMPKMKTLRAQNLELLAEVSRNLVR